MWHVWETGEAHTVFFYFGNLKERDHSEHLGVDRTILK